MGFMDRIREAMSIADKAAEDGDITSGEVAAARGRSPREQELLVWLRGEDGTERVGEPAIRLYLRFSGMVQGVGFRWTNQGLARERHIAGWVKNLSDGTVAMEVQAPPQLIAAHLDTVHESYRRFGYRIWLDEYRQLPPHAGETDFEVRF